MNLKINIIMSKHEILKFEYVWNIDRNEGFVKYYFDNGRKSKWIKYEDKTEFQIIIFTLINIKPIYLVNKKEGRLLSTGIESVGEIGTLNEML